MNLLDTASKETIYQSLSNILNVSKEFIEYFIHRHMFEIRKISAEEINLINFFKFLSSYSKVKINTDFDITHVTISHLSPDLALKV